SGEIDSGPRGGDVERDAVFLGKNGDGVSTDLIGDVAIGGDAVRADDHRADLAEAHHRASHVVGNNGGRDAVMLEFPGGEARALQEGTGLVRVNIELAASSDGGADDA